ncbi:hypothetical protein Tco_0952878 [Tanacetum coccineum]|uniref:Uncharacterized protein n=1 Tax=Tanacetum coccineum TaxID=301880 RepID=A0ABQ5E040_9ASTR
MNQQETQQVIARDENWIPSADRAFTIFADVPEIFMQQFWYTIKKVHDTDSYEFLLANKKCRVDAEVFRKILDICLRVNGEEFTELQNDDDTLTFLIDLGYKGPLHKHTNMFMDNMHQPWRTLAEIINKCLSRKTASNDKLRKSRIDIIEAKEDQDVKICHSPDSPQLSSIIVLNIYSLLSNSNNLKDTIVQSRMMETVDVSEESKPKPEHVKKKNASRRVVKKKVTISADDNIISDPDVTLKLGKSISLTEAEEEEAVSDPKPKPAASKPKLKGAQSLTPTEKEVANIMLKKARRPARDSQVMEAQVKELVGYQGFSMSPQSSLLPEVKELSEYSEEDRLDDKEKDDKDGDADDKGLRISVRKDEYEEMSNVEVEDSRKGNAKISNVGKADAAKTKEVKDDSKKAELPPASSNLSVSLVLHISSPSVLTVPVSVIFEPSVLSPIPETPSAALVTTLPPPSVSTTPPIPQQTKTPIPTPPIIADASTITTIVLKSNALFAIQLRVAKLEKDMSELKKVDHSAEALTTLKSQVPTTIDSYLGSKFGDTPTINLKQGSGKSASEILKIKREQGEKQKMPKLYHTLMEALIEDENAMDKGVSNTIKYHKRKHDDDEDDDDDDDDEDPPARPN